MECGASSRHFIRSSDTPYALTCPTCLEPNAPEDEFCHICATELDDYSDEDDSVFAASYSVFRERNIEELDPNTDILLEVGKTRVAEDLVPIQWCLTCDSHERSCECSIQDALPLSEIQEAVYDAGVEPYDPNGFCDTCVFLFSANCVPYREWLRSWAQDQGSVKEQELSGCEDYRSNL